MQPAITFEILLFGVRMTKKDIAKTVRELRHVARLTWEQFAAKVGVGFSAVNRWERKVFSIGNEAN